MPWYMPQVCMYTTDCAWISVLMLRYAQVCSVCIPYIHMPWYMPQVCMYTTDHAWISVLMLRYAQVCSVCMIYIHMPWYMPQVCMYTTDRAWMLKVCMYVTFPSSVCCIDLSHYRRRPRRDPIPAGKRASHITIRYEVSKLSTHVHTCIDMHTQAHTSTMRTKDETTREKASRPVGDALWQQ